MADMKIEPRTASPGWDTADSSNMKLLRGTRDGAAFTADYLLNLLMQGRVFTASDADENDRVTGQTSYAATTPTFLLSVPSGAIAMPLLVNLGQAGTVAGGDISVMLSYDRVNRWSTGGTTEAVSALRTDRLLSNKCTLYSGATATGATDARTLLSLGEIAAVAGAGTAAKSDSFISLRAFKDFLPPILVGPAAFLVFSYAGSTGPTWEWAIQWAELPANGL